jgi:hypothetical protein
MVTLCYPLAFLRDDKPNTGILSLLMGYGLLQGGF